MDSPDLHVIADVKVQARHPGAASSFLARIASARA